MNDDAWAVELAKLDDEVTALHDRYLVIRQRIRAMQLAGVSPHRIVARNERNIARLKWDRDKVVQHAQELADELVADVSKSGATAEFVEALNSFVRQIQEMAS